jgi:hypothetical protein
MLVKAISQEQKITNTIKDILSRYPYGTQIMKEYLQNADDAKLAKKFSS